MSFDRLLLWNPLRCRNTSVLALLAMGFLFLTGCADHSVDVMDSDRAYLSLGAVFPDQAAQQLGSIDAWMVQVSRPGQGVIAEDMGAVGPEQQTITVEFSLTLEAACEVLTVVIELSSGGEVWFRSEQPTEVCVGSENGVQAQQLEWVGPLIGLTTSGLSFTLEEGGDPLTGTLTVTNLGGGTLSWAGSEDRWWLGLSKTSGSLGAGQSDAITVTVSDIDLSAGQYQGTITVSDPNAVNSPVAAQVTLTYVEAPRIGLSTGVLSFTTDEGVEAVPQTLTITNVGGGTLNWTATEDAGWLVLSPLAGALGPGESHDVLVRAVPGERPGGVYNTVIQISDPAAANSPRSVNVQMTVVSRPVIGLEPGILSFTTNEGEDPPSQILSIMNEGGGTLNWVATVIGAEWLELSALFGSVESDQAQDLTVSVDAADLQPGEYLGSIVIEDPQAMNSPQVVGVSLLITEGPLIGLSETVINLYWFTGEAEFVEHNVVVSNAGGGLLEWQATPNAPWIILEPNSGQLGTLGGVGLATFMRITIRDPETFKAGSYQGSITVSDPDAANSPRTIWVRLFVQDRVPPVISDFEIDLVKLNDPTCDNPQGDGSRFSAVFKYQDPNGDIPIEDNSFVGTPVEVTAGFPDFQPTVSQTTADVVGTPYQGQASFDLCIYFWQWGGANVWIRLQDEVEKMSNQLFQFIERPEGANAPPQGVAPEGSTATPDQGSVLIPIRGPLPPGG